MYAVVEVVTWIELKLGCLLCFYFVKKKMFLRIRNL